MESENQVKFYFGIITASLAFVIIAGGFIIVAIRYQKRLLGKQRELLELDAQHKKELLLNSISSAESEREQIAKDIHDEIGSIFSTLSLSINQISENNPQNGTHLDMSKKLLQTGIDSVRRISHAIVPFELELLGLEDTLGSYFDTLSSASGIDINFENQARLHKLNHAASLSCYRIVQELCSNCLKHAAASTISIHITENTTEFILTYKDNGKGMEPELRRQKKGIGLKNIESRAISLNGRVHYTTAPNAGFTCEVFIPHQSNLIL